MPIAADDHYYTDNTAQKELAFTSSRWFFRFGGITKREKNASVSACFGMAVTSLLEVENALAEKGFRRTGDKDKTYHVIGHKMRERIIPDGLVVFVTAASFYRHVSRLTERHVVLVLDGGFSLCEIDPIRVLDTSMTCPAEMACAPSFDRSRQPEEHAARVQDFLAPVMEAVDNIGKRGPVAVSIYRMKTVSNIPHTLVSGGVYQDVMTVVFNHGDPGLQRSISQYVLDALTSGEPVSKEEIVKDVGSMAPTNPTRAAFIERMATSMSAMDEVMMLCLQSAGAGLTPQAREAQEATLLISSLNAILGRRGAGEGQLELEGFSVS